MQQKASRERPAPKRRSKTACRKTRCPRPDAARPGARPAPDGREPAPVTARLNAGRQGPPAAAATQPGRPGSQPYPPAAHAAGAPMPATMPQAPMAAAPAPRADAAGGHGPARHAAAAGPPGPDAARPLPQPSMPRARRCAQPADPAGCASSGSARPCRAGTRIGHRPGRTARRGRRGPARPGSRDSSAPVSARPAGRVRLGRARPRCQPHSSSTDPQAGAAPGVSAPARSRGPTAAPQGALVPMSQAAPQQPMAVSLADAVQAAHAEGFGFGDAVARDAPRCGWRRFSPASRGCLRILRPGCCRAPRCRSTRCCTTRSDTRFAVVSGTRSSARAGSGPITNDSCESARCWVRNVTWLC